MRLTCLVTFVLVVVAVLAWVGAPTVSAQPPDPPSLICQYQVNGPCLTGPYGYCCAGRNTVCKNHTCRKIY